MLEVHRAKRSLVLLVKQITKETGYEVAEYMANSEIKWQSELFKDWIEDLKDPLFLLFWSGQRDWHIYSWSGTFGCGVEYF